MSGEISTDMIEGAYTDGKEVWLASMTMDEAVDSMWVNYDMNRTSAYFYLSAFQDIMMGIVYKKSINNQAAEYFLGKILSDFGPAQLSKAISSIDQHIKYYKTQQSGKVVGLRNISQKYKNILTDIFEDDHPHEIKRDTDFMEGNTINVSVNKYERDKMARKLCLEHFKAICSVCNFNFCKEYGEIGRDFIHVHHLKPLSSIGKKYKVDPIKDLRPVCPNCHAMLHKRKKPFSIEEMKTLIRKSGGALSKQVD